MPHPLPRSLELEAVESIDPYDNKLDFGGAKALITIRGLGGVFLRRDYKTPTYPGCLDLIGGGREDGESPFATVVREAQEEANLTCNPSEAVVIHAEKYRVKGLDGLDDGRDPPLHPYGAFLVVRYDRAKPIPRLGNEGLEIVTMPIREYLARTDAWPVFQQLTRRYLNYASIEG